MKKAAIACVQMAPKVADKKYNLQCMETYIHRIMSEHPDTDMILFPELATSGYDCTVDEFRELAETSESGMGRERLSALAAEYAVYIAYGYPEYSEEGLYNSMLLIGRSGETVSNYRKVHPFGDENIWCRKGDDIQVAETDFGTIGMMICYDTMFPELSRTLVLQGAELLVISTNWENPHSADWDLCTRARAFDNVVPLVAANRVGEDRTNSFFGHSCILNPIGESFARLDEPVEGYIWHMLDLDQTKEYREGYYPTLQDRRPEVYFCHTKEAANRG